MNELYYQIIFSYLKTFENKEIGKKKSKKFSKFLEKTLCTKSCLMDETKTQKFRSPLVSARGK